MVYIMWNEKKIWQDGGLHGGERETVIPIMTSVLHLRQTCGKKKRFFIFIDHPHINEPVLQASSFRLSSKMDY